MLFRIRTAAIVALLTSAACQSPNTSAEWTYGGDTGPAHWGDLSPEYVLAKTGRRQSPIDITGAVPQESDPIEVRYHPTTIDIINNGHTIEDDYSSGGAISVGGHEYALAQFHFHSPSEHTINGEHSPMEMHLVHVDADGKLAVIAVMIAEGEENADLASLARHCPKTPGRAKAKEGVTVNATDLLPKSLASYRYSGSLTTPPCSEDVAWFVLQDHIEASKEQIAGFRELYYGNNRPTQPLNGRTVGSSK